METPKNLQHTIFVMRGTRKNIFDVFAVWDNLVWIARTYNVKTPLSIDGIPHPSQQIFPSTEICPDLFLLGRRNLSIDGIYIFIHVCVNFPSMETAPC